MANLIEATVYQIDGNPQKDIITVAFDTNKIRLQETTVSTIPQVTSFIEVEGEKLNAPVVKYFVSETVATLVSAANTGGTTLLQANVVAINENPFKVAKQMAFPANKVTVWSFINGTIQSFLQLNEDKFYATDSKASLIAAANAGGGGGTNPTSTFIPFNNAGTFADSFLVNDITENRIYTQYLTNELGLSFDFTNNLYFLGAPNGNNGNYIIINEADNYIELSTAPNSGNTTTLKIDDNNSIIFTKYNGNEIGLNLDFANTVYNIGDFNFVNSGTHLNINDNNGSINTYSSGNQVGIILSFDNRTYTLGDPNGSNNGSSFGVDDDQQTLTCTNVTSLDPGVSIAGFIKMKVDGNYYVMPYYSI